MLTFYITWNETDFSYGKLKPIIEKFKVDGKVENRWSCGSTRNKISLDDRIFFLKKGPGIKGIFGAGKVTKTPYEDLDYNEEVAKNGKTKFYINVEFDYLCDPREKVVINEAELKSPELENSCWKATGSGKTIPIDIAKQLELIWASRIGATDLVFPEVVKDEKNLWEGAVNQIHINAYERNSEARKKCIEHFKPHCVVCRCHFELRYGSIGKGYIHVHHLIPLSEIGEEYVVNPIEDLRPVCPNCHAMLHQKGIPPGSDGITELQKLFKSYNK